MAAFYAERARGGVGLIVTGGIAPNEQAALSEGGAKLTTEAEAPAPDVTEAVHAAGGKIAMQILHSGRYAYHPDLVAPSAIQAPINPLHAARADGRGGRADHRGLRARRRRWRKPRGLRRRRDHGLRGLPDQPVPRRAHQPAHRPLGRQLREPHALPASRSCAASARRVGPDFIIIYRLSMLDLVEGGSTLDEIVTLAKAIEAAGATIINTGIGWHEARIPTIATTVPRAAFTWVTAGCGLGEHSADHHQPHQHPGSRRADSRRGRRRHGVDGAAVPRRPGFRQQGARRPRRRQSTPASAATRPASTTPSAARSPAAWSTRAPATRPSSSSRRPGSASRSPWSAPARPGSPAPSSAAERGHAGDAVRRGRARSAASSTSPRGCRARKSSTRPCATSAAARTSTTSTCA